MVTLASGTNDGGRISKATSTFMRQPTHLRFKGLQQQRKPGETPASYWGSGYDWLGWQKPQADLAIGLGANGFKVHVGTSPVVSGTVDLATFKSRVGNLIDYAAANSVYVYAMLTDTYTDNSAATDTATRDTAVAMAAYLQGKSNVVAFDMRNEGLSHDIPGGVAQAQVLRPRLLDVTNKPLSMSVTVGSAGNWTDTSSAGTPEIAPYVDFFDFHPYYAGLTLDPGHLHWFRRASSFYKPFLIGECGRQWSAGNAAVRTFWTTLGVFAQMPDCFGVFGYSTMDFETPAPASAYGIYASDFTGPRTDASQPFAAWPTGV